MDSQKPRTYHHYNTAKISHPSISVVMHFLIQEENRQKRRKKQSVHTSFMYILENKDLNFCSVFIFTLVCSPTYFPFNEEDTEEQFSLLSVHKGYSLPRFQWDWCSGCRSSWTGEKKITGFSFILKVSLFLQTLEIKQHICSVLISFWRDLVTLHVKALRML